VADLCVMCRRALPAYVAGELEAKERDDVRSHVESCARCHTEEIDFRRSHGALEAEEARTPPYGLHALFSARLAARHARREPATRSLRFATAIGLAILVVGTGFAVRNRAPVASITPPAIVGSNPAIAARQPAITEPLPPVRNVPSPVRERYVGRTRHGLVARRVAMASPSFLDVTDSAGHSARMILHPAGVATPRVTRRETQRTPVPAEHKWAIVSLPMHERVRFDGRHVMIDGERGWDARGRLALIRVRVDADPDAQPAPDPTMATPAGTP
jgi:hypothetical protein